MKGLIVLPPGMPADGAPEEPDLALIGSPELAEPPECKVVLALGALDRDRREGRDRTLLLDDNDLLLAPLPRLLELVFFGDLPNVPALPAFELARRGYHQALALRTEHWFINLCTFMIKAPENVGTLSNRQYALSETLFSLCDEPYRDERALRACIMHLFSCIPDPHQGTEILRYPWVDCDRPLPVCRGPLLPLHQQFPVSHPRGRSEERRVGKE